MRTRAARKSSARATRHIWLNFRQRSRHRNRYEGRARDRVCLKKKKKPPCGSHCSVNYSSVVLMKATDLQEKTELAQCFTSGRRFSPLTHCQHRAHAAIHHFTNPILIHKLTNAVLFYFFEKLLLGLLVLSAFDASPHAASDFSFFMVIN